LETVAVICARGGSKGVPGKNIRLLGGKPLIAYAIETALSSKLVNRVIVSTDDVEIANVARRYGAGVPFMRPPELACDDSPEWLVWQHAIRTLEPKMDVFVSVPPTSPLRSVDDVNNCIKTLLESDADIVITVRPADRNPYFNMVILDKSGYARLVIPPNKAVQRRQDAPTVFDVTTVAYAARPEFILNAGSIFEGKVGTVIVPSERALDIDTESDFKIEEYYLSRSTHWGERT
jgi:CMP-N-acetylneuraminic acid synthetase